MKKDEYFYYEWLIIQKHMTLEKYMSLSEIEILNLINEYKIFLKK
jgi:hypothetical protein